MSGNSMLHQHRHKETGNPWFDCTLCRSHKQSISLYDRASLRAVKWPPPRVPSQPRLEEPGAFTSIDDAFSTLMQSLSTSSRQCKRFYKSCPETNIQPRDRYHCNRFHTPQYTHVQRNNPIESTEDVHMVIHPGTYAVTAGEWGTTRQQTHVVHLQPGQNVNLDFVL